ncbi:cyclase family protein [Alkaliphilus serpentinus]|uniref:Cyclase family protein n=1 Tax=Alkaliphilus serpentinus TaxID=1482731 RepID=A0A833M7V4_9FIRM|nr:cyclase family protein [Alkaliphilus serpentinus]KAB3531397.1 cyclase family protein [Alkaliphilus serpentinus]
MNIIDLTQLIEENMPVFPGTKGPNITQTNTLEDNGFVEHLLAMYTHTGTHMDAPAHMIEGGKSLDQYSADSFIGKAVKIDFLDKPKGEIGVEDLLKYKDQLETADFLIIHTGWSEYWGTSKYFEDFPALGVEAAQWLMNYNLKGIGVDAISVDAMTSIGFPIHNTFMKKNFLIIENLTNLLEVRGEFIFSCLPLKVVDSDGSPIRAIAMI